MTNEFEIEVVRFFNELGRGTFVDGISWLVSYIPFLVALVLIFMFFAYFYDSDRKNNKKRSGKWKAVFLALVIALALHFLITNLLIKGIGGELFGIRERPYIAYLDIIPIGETYTDSSFPSGHVAGSVAVLVVLGYFYARGKKKNLIWSLIVLAGLLIGLSRLHNGMHYPSDVLFGALLGCFYGFVGVRVAEKVCKS
jgi:membrane-associated phospholipid phosphatase